MLRTLNMCKNPVRIAVIGFGYWTQYEALPLLRRDTRLKIVAAFAFTQEEAAALIQKGELTEAEMYSGSQGLTSLLERTDIQAVVVDVHMQLMMSLLPRIFAMGKHVLTRSPMQLSLANASALLDVYRPYSNSLVWHAVENNRQEEAFEQAAAKVAGLGRVTTLCFKCGTDTALKHKFSTAPYDIKHHLALDLLRCIAAVRQLTGLQLSSVSAAAKGDYAPCATGSFSPSDEGDSFKQEKLKNTRLRREYARLTGWLTLINPGGQTSTLGSFVISHCVGDNSLTYQINCVKGSVRLTKASSCWQVEVTGDKASGTTNFAVQGIGHQNCHDAFAEELYEKLYCKKQKEEEVTEEKGPTLVDISISGALEDSAVMEGIIASIQNEGAPARFRCLAPPSAESVSKTEKKAASLRSLSSQQSAARA
ncbi:uncharacterized protein EMH_0080590 [Eimeria mitis]|uniref:Gfo/Idh/MocA-like oxidoreductase N-terminal domain-containing protein n=1 Tax=Eimeria mitis TaxID=44415 RepID=U6KLQ1_9EIME|nr:uncharacterized protein EMH_0080590 [Eimeria mitis]CDJ36358.1 hypothetical protein EMH_0080590 [Eimeria mitis]